MAIKKINWRAKIENFEEILEETNLLPRNVLFIDDNPIERASIEAAFPGVRTLGANPLVWRRLLLWSAETQVASITTESARRTEMVQAQVEREAQRKQLSREEFLSSLNVTLVMREIASIDHPNFSRALELINKSNQYNTTGRRWTSQECGSSFSEGTRFFVFEVSDRFTEYGLVGVIIVDGTHIVQYVMSCRVVGLEVELAAISELMNVIFNRTQTLEISAELKETDLNLLARDLWVRCGFDWAGSRWSRASRAPLPVPVHIKIESEVGKADGAVDANYSPTPAEIDAGLVVTQE